MNKTFAYRCSECDLNWPHVAEFKSCPVCESETWHTPDEEPLTITEARVKSDAGKLARKRRQEFEQYYVEYAVEQLGKEIEEWGVLGHDPHAAPAPMFEEQAFQKFLRTVGFTPEDGP